MGGRRNCYCGQCQSWEKKGIDIESLNLLSRLLVEMLGMLLNNKLCPFYRIWGMVEGFVLFRKCPCELPIFEPG